MIHLFACIEKLGTLWQWQQLKPPTESQTELQKCTVAYCVLFPFKRPYYVRLYSQKFVCLITCLVLWVSMVSNATGWVNPLDVSWNRWLRDCVTLMKGPLLHLRYLSSWHFMSLLKTYQSFPIILKGVPCHLHRHEHSFFNILKASQWSTGVIMTLKPLRGDSWVPHYWMLH